VLGVVGAILKQVQHKHCDARLRFYHSEFILKQVQDMVLDETSGAAENFKSQ